MCTPADHRSPNDAVIRQIGEGVDILVHITQNRGRNRDASMNMPVGPLRIIFHGDPIFTYEEGEGLYKKQNGSR
jgi:hypothetical protein